MHDLALRERTRDSWQVLYQRGRRTVRSDHAGGRTEGSDRIWSLLNLELWHQLYIEGVPQESLTQKLQELCLPQ